MARTSPERSVVSNDRDRGRSLVSARSFVFVLVAFLIPAALSGCGREGPDPPELSDWPVVAAPQFPLGKYSDVAWISTHRRNEVYSLHRDEPLRLSGHVTAICPVPALDYELHEAAPMRFGFLIFHSNGAYYCGDCLREGGGQSEGGPLTVEGTLGPVRAAAPVWPHDGDTGEVVALITGGEMPPRTPGGESEAPPWVTGAELQLAWLQGERLVAGTPEPMSGTSPWALRSGRFAGEEDNLLVCVYNTAPFDDVTRRRPWIYHVVAGEDGLPHLDPRWRGTSFSRPFRDATFGDFSGTAEGEIAALEVGQDGGRLLTAYRFEGFGLEGLADSAKLPAVEDRIEAADWGGGNAEELVVRDLEGNFLFYELDTDAGTLRHVLTVSGPKAVLGWAITGAGGEPGELICVRPNGEVWRTNSDEHRDRYASAVGAG